jgi:hypothetical protein
MSYMLPGEGWQIAGRSAGMALKSGTVLLIEAEKTAMLRPRPESDTAGQAAALASVGRGWIETAEAIVRLAKEGVYVELETRP